MQSESGRSIRIPEAVVQDIWARQLFDRLELQTTDGRKVRIVNPGRHNRDAGPDFLAAQVVIGRLRWFGDVEIHLSSGIWNEHGHQHDPRYNNVVLHVSLMRDFWTGDLRRKDGTILPEIILDDYLTSSIISLMHELSRTDGQSIPCASGLASVEVNIVRQWIYRLARVRIEKRMADHAHASAHSRRGQLVKMIFRALGYSKNADAMERLYFLASPFFKDVGVDELPALLLGIADLLPDSDRLNHGASHVRVDRYKLVNCFAGLAERLSLPAMNAVEWNYFRLRPASFPDARIRQAASIVSLMKLSDTYLTYPSIRKTILSANPLRQLRKIFSKPAWAPADCPLPGQTKIDRLIINAVAPFVLVESVLSRDEGTANAMLSVLSSLPAEKDSVTKVFESLGIANTDAYFSQGLHELRREYCSNLKCLTCDIGTHLLHSSHNRR